MDIKHLFSLSGLYTIKGELLPRLGLDSLVNFLARHKISPNHITIFNLSIGFLALYFLFRNQALFTLFMGTNFLLDILDGYYARSHGLVTKNGDLLDHVADYSIGLLAILKSYLVIQETWILLSLVVYLLAPAIIHLFKLWSKIFPSRLFLILFLFGFYEPGLLIQAIYQPVALATVIITGKLKPRK